jgi:dihydrolipoamide dehydrogenase
MLFPAREAEVRTIMADHYEVVVGGAGPGGYVAAIRPAQLGLRTAFVEQKYWGGVCLNVGCITSKALLRNAELAHMVTKQSELFGISGDPRFDYATAFDRSRAVAQARVKGVHYLTKKNGIIEYSGKGSFTNPHTVCVEDSDGAVTTVSFDNAITAPGSVLIVGAGAIGMEFAYVMRICGAEVIVVEFLDRALPNEDADVFKGIAKAYKKLGITIQTSSAVQSIQDEGPKVAVTHSTTPSAARHTW